MLLLPRRAIVDVGTHIYELKKKRRKFRITNDSCTSYTNTMFKYNVEVHIKIFSTLVHAYFCSSVFIE